MLGKVRGYGARQSNTVTPHPPTAFRGVPRLLPMGEGKLRRICSIKNEPTLMLVGPNLLFHEIEQQGKNGQIDQDYEAKALAFFHLGFCRPGQKR